ncbi:MULTISPECIES: cell division protein ZapE [unclassified Colwellia]|uniref:cell division protein ZapE n=1 Tax=unclassified Colwellia TaxID=196834 RepID=UPI0015F4C46E|nr:MULTISPECIES: cell division protein ZapE [unclassified Colwellia]MBA6352138.1 cell division protein ZapE [Colwellia sp. BRX9-1]MBA6355632.1 cell division protein ZapE [Colwellia sp. BRX8-3]MBA6360568.1 cell division protein ZapE [Colwellia sp. BRX8-6]MBA6367743.1 cell division protein ZapE [Colwellia sp. BRX8-5]MBA6372621.1 cell division protein ZapE [Colwellia sp. BRX8-4]
MLSAYQALSTSNNFKYDYAQVNAVAKLDDLSEQIYQHEHKSWLAKRLKKSSAIRGIYLYGRVGRGKTMLMDLFFQNLAVTAKKRIHFHRFIEEVHQQLNLCTGQSDPLTFIAKQWAKKIKVLCFDEFYVSDIGDAMLLSGLFQAFFQQDIILIATSNCRPEELYRNGLQRERFMPTIDLINDYCQVLSVDGAVDHRLDRYDETAIAYRDYTYPLNNKTLRQRFLDITGIVGTSGNITVNHRKIPFQAKTDTIILFDFYALCSGPRSQRDYISLADHFKLVLLDQVPQFDGERITSVISGVEDDYQRDGKLLSQLRHLDDEARRFIAVVDEFYDRNIRLIINAEVDIIELYQGQQLSFEFARCQSRLIEMQQLAY